MISHPNYQEIYLSMWLTAYKSILVTVYCHIVHDKLGLLLRIVFNDLENCFANSLTCFTKLLRRKSKIYIFKICNGIYVFLT